MPDQQNQQSPRKRGPQVPVPKMPRSDSFWMNLALSVFILMLFAGAYTYFTGGGKQPVDIPISAVAQDVAAGKVTTITVNGDDLKIEYADKSEKISKKEPDAALTQTLTNYGVAKDALDKVTITIQRQSSWEFWLSTLAPFLAPLLLIAFFVWYLSRQVRGAGMQAAAVDDLHAARLYLVAAVLRRRDLRGGFVASGSCHRRRVRSARGWRRRCISAPPSRRIRRPSSGARCRAPWPVSPASAG